MKSKLLLIVMYAAAFNTRAMNYGGAGPKELSDQDLKALQSFQPTSLKLVVQGTHPSVTLSNEVVKRFVPPRAQVAQSERPVVKSRPKSAAVQEKVNPIQTLPPLILEAGRCNAQPPLSPEELLSGLRVIRILSSTENLVRQKISPDSFIDAIRVSAAFGGFHDSSQKVPAVDIFVLKMLSDKRLLQACYPAERATKQQKAVMGLLQQKTILKVLQTIANEDIRKQVKATLGDIIEQERVRAKGEKNGGQSSPGGYSIKGVNSDFVDYFADSDRLLLNALSALCAMKNTDSSNAVEAKKVPKAPYPS